ncbi:MAG: adenosylcobinamide-GDP ribazoletransferase [Rhizobiaceae bacterium]|nr:adenosylcobinamide-GDP ribazoletransferase [Rhizobiaceae bacterium]
MASGNPIGDIAACIAFYTRLPAGALGEPSEDFAGAQWAAPIAGGLVGLIGAIVLIGADWIGLPPLVSALLAVAATMLVTGGLHEDGLADTADGLGASTRERKLEVMRDSATGTFGAAAVVFSILLRTAAIAALPPAVAFVALIAAHAGGRALIPYLLATLQPARADGLSASVGAVGPTTARIALAIGAVMLVLAGIQVAIVAALALAIWLLAVRTLARRQLGGHTGDVCGSLEQGGEILVLLVAAAAMGYG